VGLGFERGLIVNRWDALVSGDKKIIPPESIPHEGNFKGHEYKRFKLRQPWVTAQATERQKVQDRFLSASRKLEIRIMSGYNSLETGLPCGGFFVGRTNPNIEWFDQTKFTIALELIEPLLRSDLNPAERAVDTFRLAVMIIHETAVCWILRTRGLGKADHILKHILWLEQNPGRSTAHTGEMEPYFEDEICAEL
jgi:hypothetical protein